MFVYNAATDITVSTLTDGPHGSPDILRGGFFYYSSSFWDHPNANKLDNVGADLGINK